MDDGKELIIADILKSIERSVVVLSYDLYFNIILYTTAFSDVLRFVLP